MKFTDTEVANDMQSNFLRLLKIKVKSLKRAQKVFIFISKKLATLLKYDFLYGYF